MLTEILREACDKNKYNPPLNLNDIYLDLTDEFFIGRGVISPHTATNGVCILHLAYPRIQKVALLMEYGANPDLIRNNDQGTITMRRSLFHRDISTNNSKEPVIAQYIYDKGFGTFDAKILVAIFIFHQRFLTWMIQHPTRPLDIDMIITTDVGKQMCLCDLALTVSHRCFEALRILKGYGGQYIHYKPEEIAKMEEIMNAETGDKLL
jgi:hypothetical protein